jgi:hypothetical protein
MIRGTARKWAVFVALPDTEEHLPHKEGSMFFERPLAGTAVLGRLTWHVADVDVVAETARQGDRLRPPRLVCELEVWRDNALDTVLYLLTLSRLRRILVHNYEETVSWHLRWRRPS